MTPTLPFNKKYLIDNYLYGIDLTDDNGNPYPNSVYELAVRGAVSWIEAALDINVVAKTVTDEHHDWTQRQQFEYPAVDLKERPINAITSMSYYWGTVKLLDVPADWIVRNDDISGNVDVVPVSTATLTGTAYQVFCSWNAAGLFGRHGGNGVPGFFHVTYSSGFADNYQWYNNGDQCADPGVEAFFSSVYSYVNWGIDPVIIDTTGKYAVMNMLGIAGDMLGGAGIASVSLGIDGLSQSKATTSSATNAGYGARIIQYGKDIKRDLPLLRRKYHGFKVGVA